MSLYAIISTSGTQYQVELGDVLELNLINNPGKTITFDQVLLLKDQDKVEIGQPTLKGVTVTAKVLEESIKGDKLRIFRYKAKSRYRRTKGYRDSLTRVQIDSIAGKKAPSTKAKPKAKPKK